MSRSPLVGLTERRGAGRIPSRQKVPCRIKSATVEGGWLGTILDVSANGIGLVANRPFKPGMLLTVELPSDGAGGRRQGRPRLVRVTHAKPHPRNRMGNQTWILGGVFVKGLGRAELDALRSLTPTVVPAHDRRTAVRYTTRLQGPCPIVRATEEGCWWARLRNVSRAGAALIVNRPFRPGTFLSVELPMQGGQLLGEPRLLR